MIDYPVATSPASTDGERPVRVGPGHVMYNAIVNSWTLESGRVITDEEVLMAPTVDYLESRRDALMAEAERQKVELDEDVQRAVQELDRRILEELGKPTEESLGIPDDAVIWFQTRLGPYDAMSRRRLYTYSAVRIPQLDVWAVTGPQAGGKYFTFRELWDRYLKAASQEEFGIQLATKWKNITP